MFSNIAIYEGINEVWFLSFQIDGLPSGENVRSVEITKAEAELLIAKHGLFDHNQQDYYC